jgi:hypothetical protein
MTVKVLESICLAERGKESMVSQELESVKAELKALEVIGYDSYGMSSVEAVKSTLSSLKKYDELHPPQQEVERIRETALARRKG